MSDSHCFRLLAEFANLRKAREERRRSKQLKVSCHLVISIISFNNTYFPRQAALEAANGQVGNPLVTKTHIHRFDW